MGQVSRVGTGSGATRENFSIGTVERGLGIAASLVQRSVSMGTWQAYSRVWRIWEELLGSVGGGRSEDGFEAILLYFIGLEFEKHRSFSSVSKSVSAIAFWLKVRGFRDVTKFFLVRRALAGYRKQGVTRDARRPVSFELLEKICQVVREICSSPFEERLFRAAFALAFFGAFRISELVASSRSVVGGLLRGDVCFADGGVVCFLRHSKTDQLGRGKRVFLYRLPGSSVCPVQCVGEFLEVRPEGQLGLLVHQDGRSLSRFQFLAVFRRCLSELGIPARSYCTHSFRIGAATEAARWGLSDEVIKRIGRWESERFRGYVRPQLL